MASCGTHWLTALRRKRRGVLLALLPALLLWTASGSACLAMLAGDLQPSHAAAQSEPVGHGNAHGEHTHAAHTHVAPSHEQAPPAPSHDCPHCPPHHGTDATAHAACVDSTDTPTSQATSSGLTFAAWLPSARSTLQIASPIPPLILLPRRNVDPPPPHVPLNIRHCVLLV
jgi:hypothetical protein